MACKRSRRGEAPMPNRDAKEGLSGPIRRILPFAVICALFLTGPPWSGFAPSGEAEAARRIRKKRPARRVKKGGILGDIRKKKEPIHITSDRMEAFSKINKVVFIGNVMAVQGKMQIQSDRLVVYGKRKKGAGKGKTPPTGGFGPDAGNIDRIVATGNVLLNQDKQKYAAGQRLEYTERTGVVVLTGNPRAWEGKNEITGEKIEIFLNEDRTVVHGRPDRRVNVTLFPRQEPAKRPRRRPSRSANAQ